MFILFPNLPPGDCLPGIQQVYTDHKLTPGNCLQGCSLFIRFPNLPPGNCRLGCSLFTGFPNLPQGNCQLGVQLVYTVSEPICRGLLAGGAAGFYCFCAFLQETVGQGYSLFIRFRNLLQGICPIVVQSVYKVAETTYKGLSEVQPINTVS